MAELAKRPAEQWQRQPHKRPTHLFAMQQCVLATISDHATSKRTFVSKTWAATLEYKREKGELRWEWCKTTTELREVNVKTAKRELRQQKHVKNWPGTIAVR